VTAQCHVYQSTSNELDFLKKLQIFLYV
jgi:hypothetical protein